jgi:hypothetical protein
MVTSNLPKPPSHTAILLVPTLRFISFSPRSPPKTSPGPVTDTSTPVEVFGSLAAKPSQKGGPITPSKSPLTPNYLDTKLYSILAEVSRTGRSA